MNNTDNDVAWIRRNPRNALIALGLYFLAAPVIGYSFGEITKNLPRQSIQNHPTSNVGISR